MGDADVSVLGAGDLDTLRVGTYSHDVLACSLPPGFTGRIVQDATGAGRSRYYLLGCVFPGPDEWGATWQGIAVPEPPTVPACR